MRLSHCLLGALLVAACGEEGVGPPAGTTDVVLELTGLRALDSVAEGTYEAWAVAADGRIASAGRFSLPLDGPLVVVSPIGAPAHFMITVEPPGDADDRPSPHKLLGGRFTGATAVLDINRYVTAGIPLEPAPGTHVLFTPSDNAELGYPSHEDAGIWLFNIRGDTLDGSFYLTFTPLTAGWSYEGWVVRDYASDSAVWLSYGKFAPDQFRKANTRDDTGLGPYSGQLDYRQAMPQEIRFPGDDWVANPYGEPVPGDVALPIDLNGGGPAALPSRWTHVITIEPWGPDRDPEMPRDARPFLLAPYSNPIGQGRPEEPRTIEYHAELLPTGIATLAPAAR